MIIKHFYNHIMKPSAFCTVSTDHHNLIGLLLSLSIHHTNEKIFCLVDTRTKKYLDELTPQPKLNITWIVELDKYLTTDHQETDHEETISKSHLSKEYLLEKIKVIDYALQEYTDVMYIKSDTFVLGKLDEIEDPIDSYAVQLQLQFSQTALLWINDKNIPKMCRNYIDHIDKIDEKIIIENLEKELTSSVFEDNFHITNNFFTSNSRSFFVLQRDFQANLNDRKIYYQGKELKSVQINFMNNNGNSLNDDNNKNSLNDDNIKKFNEFIFSLLRKVKRYPELLIIQRIVDKHWTIQIPTQPKKDHWAHGDDMFRELAVMLSEKNNDLIIERHPGCHVWLKPDVLLQDRPNYDPDNRESKKALLVKMGNMDVKIEGRALEKEGYQVKPWIFWPRTARKLEALLGDDPRKSRKKLIERIYESIFIGNYENSVQEKYRKPYQNMEKYITFYHCLAGQKQKFSQEEYLEKLSDSKFGLCLRGYGSKCNREIELMALGTVPLITPDVNIDSYQDPPQEGKHFIRLDKEDDYHQVVNSITDEKWEEMSQNCVEWYMKNSHSNNCWQNTIEDLLYNFDYNIPVKSPFPVTKTNYIKLNEYHAFYNWDSYGNDVKYLPHKPLNELKEICDQDNSLIAFNTLGYFKNKIKRVNEFFSFPNVCLYVHKERFANLVENQLEYEFDKNYKIALLVSTTGRGIESIDELPILNILIPSLIKSKVHADNLDKVEFVLYIGYDENDPLYDNEEVLLIIKNKINSIIKDSTIKDSTIKINVNYYKYHNDTKSPVLIWNHLFKQAYQDQCDYFYQLGDDIEFINKYWLEHFIHRLKTNSIPDFGAVGPVEVDNLAIITQSFVSRTHYDIFGYYFPPTFKNWFCDNWIDNVYNYFCSVMLNSIYLKNSSDVASYQIDYVGEQTFHKELQMGIATIKTWLSKKGLQEVESICTLATNGCYHELELMLYSLVKIRFQKPILILCDSLVEEKIKLSNQNFKSLKIQLFNQLNTYTDINRYGQPQRWTEFMLTKCDVIDIGLEKYANTLYVDCDIFFINSYSLILPQEIDIGLSTHGHTQSQTDQFGKYNGGYVFVKNCDFTNWWREETRKNPKYHEQKILDQAPEKFVVVEIPWNHNFGWWRVIDSPNKEEMKRRITINNQTICLDNQPIINFHTHLNDKFYKIFEFNDYLINLLKQTSHKEIIQFIENNLNAKKSLIFGNISKDDFWKNYLTSAKELNYQTNHIHNQHLLKTLGIQKIYCINLGHCTSRWERMSERFKKYGIKVERFEAITPEHELVMKTKETKTLPSGKNDSYYACSLSHLGVIRDALENNYNKIIVLEDDVQFLDNWILFLEAWLRSIDKLDLFIFDSSMYDSTGFSPGLKKNCHNSYCAGGYVISNSAIQEYVNIYDNSENFKNNEDIMCRIYTQNNSYTSVPRICVQENLDTNIQTEAHIEKLQNWMDNVYFKIYDPTLYY